MILENAVVKPWVKKVISNCCLSKTAQLCCLIATTAASAVNVGLFLLLSVVVVVNKVFHQVVLLEVLLRITCQTGIQ